MYNIFADLDVMGLLVVDSLRHTVVVDVHIDNLVELVSWKHLTDSHNLYMI